MIAQWLVWDAQLFECLNGQWHHPFLDVLMPYWRHKLFWLPLYTFLLSFLLLNYRRHGLFFALALACVISVSDFCSSKLVKQSVQRARPCHQAAITEQTRVLVRCGSGHSFTSSHATNHFAIGLFLAIILGKRFRWLRWAAPIWAASIAYGQVYVGVHYPLDILCGAALGTLIAWSMAKLYQQTSPGQLFLQQIVAT